MGESEGGEETTVDLLNICATLKPQISELSLWDCHDIAEHSVEYLVGNERAGDEKFSAGDAGKGNHSRGVDDESGSSGVRKAGNVDEVLGVVLLKVGHVIDTIFGDNLTGLEPGKGSEWLLILIE